MDSFIEFFQGGHLVVSALAIFVGLVITVYSKIFKPFYQFCNNRDEDSERIKAIMAELFPNGGSSFRDAIDRIEVRQLLSEQRQRIFFQDLNLAVCETNASGECIWVNRTFARLTGRLPSELLKFNWVNAIAEEDRDRVMSEWLTAVEQRREFNSHYSVLHTSGEKIPVYARTFPLYGIERKVINNSATTVIGHIGLVTIDDHDFEKYSKYFSKHRYDLSAVNMPRLDI